MKDEDGKSTILPILYVYSIYIYKLFPQQLLYMCFQKHLENVKTSSGFKVEMCQMFIYYDG